MFKNIKLKLVLWALKEKRLIETKAIEIDQWRSLLFADLIRNAYIATTKESRLVQASMDRIENSISEGKLSKLKQEYIDDFERMLSEKQALQKVLTKKMFAFLGMFEAYAIPKVKPEELL